VLARMMPCADMVVHCRSSSSFLQLGVEVGAHGHGRCAGKKLDPVVVGPHWGQPAGLGEDVAVLLE
jgi:hypothetical protein